MSAPEADGRQNEERERRLEKECDREVVPPAVLALAPEQIGEVAFFRMRYDHAHAVNERVPVPAIHQEHDRDGHAAREEQRVKAGASPAEAAKTAAHVPEPQS